MVSRIRSVNIMVRPGRLELPEPALSTLYVYHFHHSRNCRKNVYKQYVMVWMTRIELATPRVRGGYSNQAELHPDISAGGRHFRPIGGRIVKDSIPPQQDMARRMRLELTASGSTDRRSYQLSYLRTKIFGKMKVVGERGSEPPTSASRTPRATRLRYTPNEEMPWCGQEDSNLQLTAF